MHVKKITSFCEVLKKMHTEENWFKPMQTKWIKLKNALPHGVYAM